MADKTETETETVTLPPAMDAETGVAMDGEFPHNHRLRAEAMARAGVETDEAGVITDELIAETVERLKRDDAAAAKADAAANKAGKRSSNTAGNAPADTNTGGAGDSKGA